MAWKEDAFDLKAAGFSDDEVASEGQRQRDDLMAGGFSQEEIDKHFGVKEPDNKPIEDMVSSNIQAKAAEYKALQAEGKELPEVADSFFEALDAGFQQSSGDMLYKAFSGKRVTPDMLLPEDAPTFYRIASQVGTIAGDIPAMIAGAVIGAPVGAATGGAVGSVAPVIGTAAGATAGGLMGAGAGGNALPTAIRQSLMEFYEKGELESFSDFWERYSAVMLNTAKDGLIGGATAGVGGKVLSSASKVMAPAASRVASVSSEIATMVTLGKSFEGEAPNAQDFLDAALVVGGLHFSVSSAKKLRHIYASTGIKPLDVVQEAQTNPVLKQDILTNGEDLPGIYKPLAAETKSVQPEAPAKPSVASEPQTAQEKIISKISTKEQKPQSSYTYNDFYKDFVDRLDPINRAVKELSKGEGIDTEANAYELSRMASDAPAKALHFLGHPSNPEGGGVLDFKTLKKVGPSLQEVLSPVKNDISGFEAYVISKRALELNERGIQSGFDLEAAKTVVTEGKTKYDKSAKDLVEFQNGALTYLKDSGVLSEKSFKNIVEVSKAYVSFKRISDDGTSPGTSKKNPIKRIKGSDLNIQDPLLSLTENTEMMIKLAETNRAKVALVEQAQGVDGQGLIEKVPTSMRPVKVSDKEFASALKEQGIEADAEAFTIFRKQDRPLAENEFEVYREGKREVYKTSPELAEAIRVLDGNPTSQNIVLKMMKGITTVKRLGISLAPDFILRNFTRDQITSSVFTKSGSINPKDVVIAMGDIWKKNDSYFNWLKAGGANGAFLKLQDNYFKENIFKLDAETGFLDKTWNIVKKPVQFIEMAATLAEQSTRLAEAKRVVGSSTQGPEVFRAGMASREITIDFQRMGAKVAAANGITAFMNAQIQGLDRTARALKSDPIGVASKASMLITAPSVLLWWANHDDERYKEIPAWQKDLFWIIPTDDWQPEEVPGEAEQLPDHLVRVGENGRAEINKGTVYRIPKPQELGILFGSLPERALEAFFTDNPDSFNDFEDTMIGMVTPSFIPDAVAPVFEQFANKSFFTQNKIVPNYLEGVLPQYQYLDYTTETGKALGKMMSAVPYIGDMGPKNAPLASPIVLENYVRSWSGSLGMYAMQVADKALRASGIVETNFEKPAWAVADIPFVKAFVAKYPSSQAESIRSFYEAFEENERVLATIKSLTKRGDIDEVEKVMFDEANEAKMQDLSGLKEALSNQGEMIQMIYKNPEMTADEKRQQIDWIYYGMIETAKLGKQLNQDFKAELQQQKATGE